MHLVKLEKNISRFKYWNGGMVKIYRTMKRKSWEVSPTQNYQKKKNFTTNAPTIL